MPYLRNYDPKEYNAAAQNWAIVQDARGVMYFGNNAGVLEYDGVSWRLIPTINHTVVRTLAIGAEGKIYVGAQGEIGYLAPDSSGQLRYVSLRESVPEEYREFGDIAKSYVTSAGVYFQALDRLMLWSHGSMHVWKPATPFHLSFVVHDRLFVRRPEIGLLEMEGDSLQLVPQGEVFSQLRIYCMLPFDENQILIGTREQGLFLYDGRVVRPFHTEIDAFLSANQLYHGVLLPDSSLALATLRGGVVIVNRSGQLLQILNRAGGLHDENIWYVFHDNQQNLWLALNNGIAHVEVSSPLSRFDESSGLRGSIEALERYQGKLYVATHQGVYYLQPRAFDRDHAGLVLPSEFKPVSGIAAQSWALLSVHDILLAGTAESIAQIKGSRVVSNLPTTNHAYVLSRSRQDSTLIYVGYADGLAALRRDATSKGKGAFGRWRETSRILGVDVEVRSIVESGGGILWLGTRIGVLRVDFSSGFSLHPQIEKMDVRHGLPAEPGLTIVFAADSKVFFMTDKGIYRFDENKQLFLPDDILGKTIGENEHIVSEASLDHAGNIWLQAGKEIFEVRREPAGGYSWHQKQFKRCADFSVYAILPESNGETWFGGPEGLVRYDANVHKNYAGNFSALIRNVIVNQDSVIWAGTPERELSTGGSQSHLPELDYSHNTLRFEFAATSFEDESANRFQYLLEGFDKGWSAWTNESKKDYTNISEGRYRFRLRAKNIYDQTGTESEYEFKILPPWYRTWWAYAVYLSGFAALVFGFIKYRTRQLEQRSRELEKVVQQRTEEIRQQAEELETLDDIVKNVNREVALENVLRSLLEQGLKLFPQAEKASVLLLDHTSGLFKFAAAAGYALPQMADFTFTREQLKQRYTSGSETVGEGVYIVSNVKNLYDDEKLNTMSLPLSVMVMAAEWQGQVEAYLVFDNLSTVEAFSHSDARKLNRFRSHAISALVKAGILQELQEKNEEIIKTQAQLVMQEKLASLGALTAGIAHEIKNPLNFVNNFAELSSELVQELQEEIEQQQGKLDARAADAILDMLGTLQQNAQKINEHGKRADGIVRGMLQHSRVQTGDRESTDLNALVQQAVNLSYHGVRAQENSFNISIHEDYDAAVGALEVMPQDLSRVFLNLINNACYALQQKMKNAEGEKANNGGPGSSLLASAPGPATSAFSPTLSVATKNLGDKIEIRIRDNGTGIPPAVRDKVFNPFFTTKPTGQGTGLGLSISYEIIQKHGGEISLDTEEGGYTEFIIRLPRTA